MGRKWRSTDERGENCYFWGLMRWKGVRPTRKVVGAAFVAGVLLIAWWWPGLTGQDQQTDIAIVSSRSLVESREFIDRRLREEGFTTEWTQLRDDACLLDILGRREFEVLVFELKGSSFCATESLESSLKKLRSTWPSRPMIAVLAWDATDPSQSILEALQSSNSTLVDPRPLIGTEDVPQNCLWWDDCPADGRIRTIETGRLTTAGMQRIARSIVSGVLQ